MRSAKATSVLFHPQPTLVSVYNMTYILIDEMPLVNKILELDHQLTIKISVLGIGNQGQLVISFQEV